MEEILRQQQQYDAKLVYHTHEDSKQKRNTCKLSLSLKEQKLYEDE